MNAYLPDFNHVNEWTEWHLTPKGWEQGTQKYEYNTQLKEVEAPEDRLLTCRYHQNITINSVWVQRHTTEIWKHSDQKLVKDMLEKFGDCPQSL
jgi:hypothetical protein